MTSDETAFATASPGAGPQDDDPLLAEVPATFAEGTFVLVGCGKSKRDPEDPVDLHEATLQPDEDGDRPYLTGPAWKAKDLYTSTYFGVKRKFAEMATQWARDRDGWAWAILSAEHGIVRPDAVLEPYDTTIDDLGADPMNVDDRVDNSLQRRRPDGREIVTEMDQWSSTVAHDLNRWLKLFDETTGPTGCEVARELLVLAGRDYVKPLTERKAWDGLRHYPKSSSPGIDIDPTFLFDEIEASGIGEQMAWLSDAVSQLDDRQNTGVQSELGGACR